MLLVACWRWVDDLRVLSVYSRTSNPNYVCRPNMTPGVKMIQTNQTHIDYSELMDEIGQPPEVLAKLKQDGDYTGLTKSVKTILDGRNRAAAISSPAGAPSDPHLHADFHEWWIVMKGEVAYDIGEYEQVVASFGDIVIAPCGYRHDIKPWKGNQCVRMVVGMNDSNHDLKGLPHPRTLPIPDDW